jgi:hypothetical protein
MYTPDAINNIAISPISVLITPSYNTSYTNTKHITQPIITPMRADAKAVILATLIDDLSSIEFLMFLITPI